MIVVAVAWVAALFVAAVALARRQRWAFDYVRLVNAVMLAIGAWEMLTTPGLISLNVVGSAILLVGVHRHRAELEGWFDRSGDSSGPLAVALVGLVVLGNATPTLAAQIPEPLDAGADDLRIEVGLECEPRRVTITTDVRWERTSFVPGGVANLTQYGDLLVLDHASEEEWALSNVPDLREIDSNRIVATSDEGYSPNQDRGAQALRGPFAIQIQWNALEAGRTHRAVWMFEPADSIATPEPLTVGFEYLHADRFRWETLVSCHGGANQSWVSPWP